MACPSAILAHVPAVRVRLAWLLVLACCGLAAEERFSDTELISLRVEFGIGDAEPTSWNGSLTVSGGELEGLSSLRPREEDRIDGSSWQLVTWQGPNFWYPAPKPQPVDGEPVNIFNSGLIVDARSRGRARIAFQTDQGSFRVDSRNLAPGQRERFLGGRVVVTRTVTAQRVSGAEYENDFAAVAAGPGGQLWVVWVAFRDWANEVKLRHYDGTAWGDVQTVTEEPGDSS